jgi:hypothetical protein
MFDNLQEHLDGRMVIEKSQRWQDVIVPFYTDYISRSIPEA